MPTYDYVCGACGHAFEHFQSMSSKRLRKCPACGERKLDRLVGTGAGVIFKGSGFYETDYKRSSTPPPTDGEGSGGSDSGRDGGRDGGSPGTKEAPSDGKGASGSDGGAGDD